MTARAERLRLVIVAALNSVQGTAHHLPSGTLTVLAERLTQDLTPIACDNSAAHTAAPGLPVWLGTPVTCPHCDCEQTHCNGCGFDMYDPPIGGAA